MIERQPWGEQLSETFSLLQHHAPTGGLPSPLWIMVVLVIAGIVLSLWGARILRAMFVLSFLAAGAAIGMRIAVSYEQDRLIGLVLGGFLLALVGYFLYRWWVGVMTALLAISIAGVLGNQQLTQKIGDFNLYFQDQQMGAPMTPEYDTGPGAGEATQEVQDPVAYFSAMRDYFWQQQRDYVYRAGGMALVIGFVGFALGVIFPRLITVIATSIIGLALLAGGIRLGLTTYSPDLWSKMKVHDGWLFALAAAWWLLSLAYQAQTSPRRGVAVPEPSPAA